MSTTDRNRLLSEGTPHWLMSAGINSLLVIAIVAAIAVVLYVFNLAAAITIPLVIAFVIGIISFPLVRMLDKIKFPRALSAAIVIAIVLAIVVASVQLTVTGVVQQAPAIGSQLISGVENLGTGLNELLVSYGVPEEQIDVSINQIIDSIQNTITGTGDPTPESSSDLNGDVMSKIMQGVFSGVNTLRGLLSGIAGMLFGMFIGAIILFYLLMDYENITSWIGAHLGVTPCLGEGIVNDVTTSLRDYFRGTTLTAVVVALGVGGGLMILKVPLIIPIMIVTFLTAYIPYFGALIAGAFACLIALGSGGLATALLALVVVVVAQNFLQSIVNAKFLGDSLDVHPIAILAMTIAGSTFLGLLGATLAAPLLAMSLRARTRVKLMRSLEEAGRPLSDIEQAVLRQPLQKPKKK